MRSFPLILAVLVVAIAVVNGLANTYSWYWTTRWLDMPMHFAGGLWLAGVAAWWRYSGKNKTAENFLQISMTCILAALGIGILWEIFESWLSFMAVGHINAIPDTLKDLLFDTIGGTMVAILVWLRVKKN